MYVLWYIYLCINYESNTLIFSNDIKKQTFFIHMEIWDIRMARTYEQTAVILHAPHLIESGGGMIMYAKKECFAYMQTKTQTILPAYFCSLISVLTAYCQNGKTMISLRVPVWTFTIRIYVKHPFNRELFESFWTCPFPISGYLWNSGRFSTLPQSA